MGYRGRRVNPVPTLRVTTGETRLYVRGLMETIRALEKTGADTADMRNLMHEIGLMVIEAARPLAPYDANSNRRHLRDDLRAGRAKNKVVIRAGRKSIPYAGVIHYGTPPSYKQPTSKEGSTREYNIAPSEFLTKAITAKQNEAARMLFDGIGEIIDKNNLERI